MNVVFLRPDMGLGGAERLIVDAATHLVAIGHRVVVLTAHHDPAWAFPETVDGTLDVRVRGGRLPPELFGRLRAANAVLRMAWLAFGLRALRPRPDVVVCDLVAHVIPFVRAVGRAPVVLYCNYPERFLARTGGRLYRWYRRPIDRLEAVGTRAAARVLVNSRHGADRFRDAFPEIVPAPEILHPGVDPLPCPDLTPEADGTVTILALGRFDPRKNLGLAVDAMAALRARSTAEEFSPVRLVLAGAFDVRLHEQRETVAELERHVAALALSDRVSIVRSPSEAERLALLARARCVVHTAVDEPFGYAPIEAMAAGRPVVAATSGGPLETVLDGQTGFLRAPHPEAFAEALSRLVTDPALAARFGATGRRRVAEAFSRARFGARFAAVLAEVHASTRSRDVT